MASISASVGRGGVNRADDVRAVQRLLNERLPAPRLAVDGICGPLTSAAIEAVQRSALGMTAPDGRVDPGGPTWRFLSSPPAPARPGYFPPEVIHAAASVRRRWAIPASVILAQWALESGWGRSMPPGSNNPFGIKAVNGEPYVTARTEEVFDGAPQVVVARFRKFGSLDEAFGQLGKLLATGAPYARARDCADDPDAFADALTGVYATDPNYGRELRGLMQHYDLYRYD